jgi:hypothetical protein
MNDVKKIVASSGGAVGLSLFTSKLGLCCIGPWAVTLLGVSGGILMAQWQALRPYMLVFAGAMLAWAFWRTYRLKRVCLATGCEERKPGLGMHASLWLATLLLVVSAFAPDLQWVLVDPTLAAFR